jgi:hypothetical protein
MRETRSSGSVEGVLSDEHSYSDSWRERNAQTYRRGLTGRPVDERPCGNSRRGDRHY